MFSFLTGVAGGSSKQGGGLTLLGTGGSGDLIALVMQCAANRGARMPANALPSLQASWTHQSRDAQDIILVTGDHFVEVEKVLEQAYGAPDPKLGSSGIAPLGNGRTLIYSPQQCGVVLNLTAASGQTVVFVMGTMSAIGNVPVMGRDNQTQPSQEELQEAAKHVWRKLKIFGALIGIFSICVVAFFSIAAYKSFGVPGLIIAAVFVAIVLWLLTRLLLLF